MGSVWLIWDELTAAITISRSKHSLNLTVFAPTYNNIAAAAVVLVAVLLCTSFYFHEPPFLPFSAMMLSVG